MVTSDEIKQRLWAAANELRGSMDASRYKDYMLGLMFYKFLSDKTLNTFAVSAGIRNLSEEEIMNSFEEEWRANEEGLKDHLLKLLGYYVKPEFLYQNWLKAINSGDFSLELVSDSLNNFERTISGKNNNSDFKGLFATSSIDLSDSALGSSLKDRSENIKGLILLFADLDMVSLQKGDILGDAYEYLIGMFAMESGKKAYIVASLCNHEKYKELSVELTNSIAIYDEDDMLIITETETAKALADKHKEVIMAALNKYGKTHILSISSLSIEALELLS